MIPDDVLPLLTDGALAFLNESVTPETRVLEFGGGGSTVWFRQRCDVTTIEHNPEWLTEGMIFHERPYYGVCDRWGDESFDIVVVDGRDRVLCAEHAARLVIPGGAMIVDNYERPYYRQIRRILGKWEIALHVQEEPNPDNPMHARMFYRDWTTAIFTKPGKQG